jgi:hypothetical protein
MANSFTRTCFVLKDIHNHEYNWLLEETKRIEARETCNETGWIFRPEVTDIKGEPPEIDDIIADITVVIEHGFDPDNLGSLLMDFLAKFRPDDVIGFEWASWSEKMEPGGFSGAAMVVTHENFDVHTTNSWLRPVRENLLNWIGTRDTPPDLGYCTPEDDEQCTTTGRF